MPTVIDVFGMQIDSNAAKAVMVCGPFVLLVALFFSIALADANEEFKNGTSDGPTDLRRGNGPYGDVTKAGDEV